jgi:hypothetical protein
VEPCELGGRRAVVVVVGHPDGVQREVLDQVGDPASGQRLVGLPDPEHQTRVRGPGPGRADQRGHSVDLDPSRHFAPPPAQSRAAATAPTLWSK